MQFYLFLPCLNLLLLWFESINFPCLQEGGSDQAAQEDLATKGDTAVANEAAPAVRKRDPEHQGDTRPSIPHTSDDSEASDDSGVDDPASTEPASRGIGQTAQFNVDGKVTASRKVEVATPATALTAVPVGSIAAAPSRLGLPSITTTLLIIVAAYFVFSFAELYFIFKPQVPLSPNTCPNFGGLESHSSPATAMLGSGIKTISGRIPSREAGMRKSTSPIS
jgi:hypothetical protein